MPTNLNALIRFKRIDQSLRNRYKPCTIASLIDDCSEAIAENRGIYKSFSERTIFDDLRVMKSDMLGFNAPIVCEGGYYSYSDPDYSIFNTSLTVKSLLKKIFIMLCKKKGSFYDDDFLEVISELSEITGVELPEALQQRLSELVKEETSLPMFSIDTKEEFRLDKKLSISFSDASESLTITSKKKDIHFAWKKILVLV